MPGTWLLGADWPTAVHAAAPEHATASSLLFTASAETGS
jgi:hypothetical protein